MHMNPNICFFLSKKSSTSPEMFYIGCKILFSYFIRDVRYLSITN